jgi:GNAT superfamily N-acetyltransferase
VHRANNGISRIEGTSRNTITDSYSAAEKNDLAGGEVDPSQTRAYALQWRPTEKHIFIVAGEKKLCHVGRVCETVEVYGHRIAVAGIGGVLVRHECRGRGYSRLAIEAAEDFMRRKTAVNDATHFLVDHWAVIGSETTLCVWRLETLLYHRSSSWRARPSNFRIANTPQSWRFE